jgi:hypothetical protein
MRGDPTMAYVNENQYKAQRNMREMIDGELNRIAVTDDVSEIDKMVACLQRNVVSYAKMHQNRINNVYDANSEYIIS